VTLSLKGANSPTRGRKLRSTGTKARARVSNGPNSLIELKKQLEARTRELAEARGHLSEALELQQATAEILGVISSSPTDVQPVFDRAQFRLALRKHIRGHLYIDGELVHFASAYGFSPNQLNGVKAKYPVHVNDRSVLSSRAILARAPVHIQDVMSDPHYDRQHAADGIDSTHQQVIAGAGTGDVEQVPLGVIDFLQVGVIAHHLDALLLAR
jgi:hypothetical protein